jgi:hypothetical protein
VNDHDAIDAINTVLEEWFKNEISQEEVLQRVCEISGRNSFEHELAKQAKP